MRSPLPRAMWIAAILLVVTAAPGAASDGLAIRATAGLDGVVRPGRWTTVAVTIENTGPAIDGDLVVGIGAARAVKRVEAGSPSRKRIEMYVRVPADAEPAITVAFAAKDPLRIPVRLAEGDTPVHVCVGRVAEAVCAATIDGEAAPQSWRGYDAADDVRIAGDARLSAMQQSAYERWRAVRHWSASPNMVAPPAPPVTAAAKSRAAVVLVAYMLVLLAACAGAPLIHARATWMHAAIAAAIVLASTAVLADGRFGSGAHIIVNDVTIVRAGAGYAGSIITSRGVAAFPAPATVELTAVGDDAVIDAGGGRRTLAKGARLSFETEAFTSSQFMSGAIVGGRLTLTNTSPNTLTECSLPSGSQPQSVDALAPGASVNAALAADTLDPVVTCTIEGRIDTVSIGGRAIRHTGTAILLYDLRPIEVSR